MWITLWRNVLMPSDNPIRYAWSPNITWRIVGIIIGAILFAPVSYTHLTLPTILLV